MKKLVSLFLLGLAIGVLFAADPPFLDGGHIPNPNDSRWMILQRILGFLDANAAANTNPTFLGGHTPNRNDPEPIVLQKILGALIDGGGGGGGGSGSSGDGIWTNSAGVVQLVTETNLVHVESAVSVGPESQLFPSLGPFGNIESYFNVSKKYESAPGEIPNMILGVLTVGDSTDMTSVYGWYGAEIDVYVPPGTTNDISPLWGFTAGAVAHGDGHITQAYGLAPFVDVAGDQTVDDAGAIIAGVNVYGTGHIGEAWGVKVPFYLDNTGIITNGYALGVPTVNEVAGSLKLFYAIYSGEQTAADNNYYEWYDSRGVYRIREDNTFDGVGQAIPSLYNPQFTKYTPGAANYERIVQQWNGNVAEVGTESGGTGTFRDLRLLGPTTIVSGKLDVKTNITFNGTTPVIISGGATYGNDRGANALDIQSTRSGATRVASGSSSIAVGLSVTSSGANSVAVGNTITASGNNSVAIGLNSSATAASAIAIGNTTSSGGVAVGAGGSASNSGMMYGINSTASANGAYAAGSGATADVAFTGNFAFPIFNKKSSTTQGGTNSISDPTNTDARHYSGVEVVLMTQELDLKTTQDYTNSLQSGVHFYPDEAGVIVTSANTVSGQPSFSFGTPGNTVKILASTAATGLTAAFKRQRYQTLLTSEGEQSLTASVTVGATATTLLGRFYWKGLLVRDQ